MGCPSREELFGFLVGRLNERASATVANHLDACTACQAVMPTLEESPDTLVARLRGPQGKAAMASDLSCQEAIARAEALMASGLLHGSGAGADSAGDGPATPEPGPNNDASPVGKRMGEYELLERLGEGGMGTVYKARHTRLDRLVALKVLAKDRTANAAAIARFEREMKAVGRVDHPNVVRAMDAREVEGTHFLVMEYVTGKDLGEVVDCNGPLLVPDACEVIRQAALGLETAHENGLVHRDIKPSNLMLTSHGQVKILDLGLALLQMEQPGGKEMTTEGQIMGTADYMAPEQVYDAHAVDIRADVYSLGCTLYKLLAGQTPFQHLEGRTAVQKMLAHLQEPVPPVRDRRPEVPAKLAAVLDRMLAKERDDRFATPAEVAEALAPFSVGSNLRRIAGDEFAAGPAKDLLQSLATVELKGAVAPSEQRTKPPDARPMVAASGGRRSGWPITAVALVLAAGGIAGMLAIVIRIREKGRETIIEVADDSQITIERKEVGPPPKPQDAPREDVPRRSAPQAASSSVPPAPQAVARPRERAFALLRQGREVAGFKTFAGLWNEHQPGDEVVVHGNGPFALGGLEVKDRALVIKAAPGYRPVFQPDASAFWVRSAGKIPAWIKLQQGSLTLDGCDFDVRNVPPRSANRPLVSGEANGPLILHNCRFLGLLDYGLTEGNLQVRSIRVENCLLVRGGGDNPIFFLSAGCEATFTNNLFWCRRVFGFRSPGGQTIHLRRNTFVFGNTGDTNPIFQAESGTKGANIVAEGNLMDFTGNMTGDGWPLGCEDFKDCASWRGKDNWYAGLWRGEYQKKPRLPGKTGPGYTAKGLSGWNSRLAEPETNSHELPELPFAWAYDLPGNASEATTWWQARLTAARGSNGLSDLGPDLSLVGPGDAYVRGLAAEGRPVSNDSLRPEGLAGGAIVLIRGGKQQRGYPTLREAVDQSQDGDTIEIRTDRPLEGAGFENRGALTLRAAPGYRPSMESGINVCPGTVLTVEGLHFRGTAILRTVWRNELPQQKQGRLRRVAYCSFDPRSDWRSKPSFYSDAFANFSCLLLDKDGNPGELFRCLAVGPISLVNDKATPSRVRECAVAGPLVYATRRDLSMRGNEHEVKRETSCTTELEASALAWPKVGWDELLIRVFFMPSSCHCTARRCYLESNMYLAQGGPEKLRWSGDRNCYRIGNAWESYGAIRNVEEWRAYTGSPETGSVLGSLPPIFDPQMWRLPADSPAHGAGPDLSRIARTEAVPAVPSPGASHHGRLP